MLVLIPLLFFLLTILWLRQISSDDDPRSAFLGAAIVWGVVTWALTEALSLAQALTAPGLALGWGFAAVVVALLAGRTLTKGWPSILVRPGAPERLELLLALSVAAIVLITGLIAVLGWPNSWDAMAYHLGRVLHWQQNQSVAHYPTHVDRQLAMPPWAEFAMLHLIVLGPDERAANLVQWFSMIGSVVGASLIARELGAGPRGQIFSALFSATLPMGILQSTSTKNDYVTAFWLVCLAFALLALRRAPASTGHALGVGAAAGLALLTKSTAPLFVAPLGVILFLPCLRRWAVGVRQAVVIGLVALVMITPHVLRNVDLYGSPLASVGRTPEGQIRSVTLSTTNEVITLPVIASNLLRGAAMHFATPSRPVNNAIEATLSEWHRWLGIGLNERASTVTEERFDLRAPALNELRAGNPLHLVLIAGSLVALAVSDGLRRQRSLLSYVGAVLAAFALLVVLLKWQSQLTRLQLPLFVLWAPVVGIVLQRSKGIVVAAALLTVLAVPALLLNQAHPLLGAESLLNTSRVDQYFRFRPSFREDYLGAVEFVRSTECTRVGLVMGWNDYEYPLWVLLAEGRSARLRIEHVKVGDASARLAERWPPFRPCAVVAVGASDSGTLLVQDVVFLRAWSSDRPNRRAAVYVPARSS